MNPLASAEQSKVTTQVNALVQMNPQSLQDIEVDWYSNLIPAQSLKGWLIRVLRPVQSFFKIPFPEPNTVLNNLINRVQNNVKEILRNRSNDRLQTMQGRSVFLKNIFDIDDNFYSLLSKISKKLEVILDIRPDEGLNLVKVKAIANFDAALQKEMPIKQLAEVAEVGNTSEIGWSILKNWFESLRTEGKVISAGAVLKAFAGSLFCQHNDYNESSYISRLLLVLLKKGYLSLSQFDTSNNPDDMWKREITIQGREYELTDIVLNESFSKRYCTLYKARIKESKGTENNNTIAFVTSRNEIRVLEWYGLHQVATGPIKPIPIMKLDEQYRYVAVSSPKAYFDTIRKYSHYLPELARIVSECVQSGISSLPEHHALVLFEERVHTLVPFVGEAQPFWMHDLAEWTFHAVSNTLEEYKQIFSSQIVKSHFHYRFFAEVVRNFLTGKGSQNIAEIAKRYGVSLEAKQIEISKFCGQLKDLKTSNFEKDNALAKQLEENHLIFPFCMTGSIIQSLEHASVK